MRKKQTDEFVENTKGNLELTEQIFSKQTKDRQNASSKKNIVMLSDNLAYYEKLINSFTNFLSKNENFDNLLSDNFSLLEETFKQENLLLRPFILKDEILEEFLKSSPDKSQFLSLKEDYEKLIPQNVKNYFQQIFYSPSRAAKTQTLILDFFFTKNETELNLTLKDLKDLAYKVSSWLSKLNHSPEEAWLELSESHFEQEKTFLKWCVNLISYLDKVRGGHGDGFTFEQLIDSKNFAFFRRLNDDFFSSAFNPLSSDNNNIPLILHEELRTENLEYSENKWTRNVESLVVEQLDDFSSQVKSFIPKIFSELSVLIFCFFSLNREDYDFRAKKRERYNVLHALAQILISEEIKLDSGKISLVRNWVNDLFTILSRIFYLPFKQNFLVPQITIMWKNFFDSIGSKDLFLDYFSAFPSKLQNLFVETMNEEFENVEIKSLTFENSNLNSNGFNYNLFPKLKGTHNSSLAQVVARWLVLKFPPFFKKTLNLDSENFENEDFLFFDGKSYAEDTYSFLKEKIIINASFNRRGGCDPRESFCPSEKDFIPEVKSAIQAIFRDSKNEKNIHIYSEDNVLDSRFYNVEPGKEKFFFRFQDVYVILDDSGWNVIKNSPKIYLPLKSPIDVAPHSKYLKFTSPEDINKYIDPFDSTLKKEYIQDYILYPLDFLNAESVKEFEQASRSFEKYWKSIINYEENFEKVLLYACFHSIAFGNKSRVIFTFVDSNSGNTGKSTFGKILSELIGNNNTSLLDWNSLFGRNASDFNQMSMVGKNLLMFEELPAVLDANVEKIKSLTDASNSKLINRKFKTPKIENINASLMAFSNYLPNFSATEGSHAIYERFHIIKWRAKRFDSLANKRDFQTIIESFHNPYWKLIFLNKILTAGIKFYGWDLNSKDLNGQSKEVYSNENGLSNIYTIPYYDFKESNKLKEEMIISNKLEDRFLYTNKTLWKDFNSTLIKIKGLRENYDYFRTLDGSIEWTTQGKRILQSLLYNLVSVKSVNTQYNTFLKGCPINDKYKYNNSANVFIEKHLVSLHNLEPKAVKNRSLGDEKIFLSKNFIENFVNWKFPDFEINDFSKKEREKILSDLSTSSSISSERFKELKSFYLKNLFDFSKIEKSHIETQEIDGKIIEFIREDSPEYKDLEKIFKNLEEISQSFIEQNFGILIENNSSGFQNNYSKTNSESDKISKLFNGVDY